MKKLIVVLFLSLSLAGVSSAQIKLIQNTAIDVAVGPFLSSSDGFTVMPSLTITSAEVRLKKNAANWGPKSQASSCTYEGEGGWYECSLDTTDTNTLGILILSVNESGAVPVWIYFEVVGASSHAMLVGGNVASTTDIATAIHSDLVPGSYAAGTAGYTLGHARRPSFVGTVDSSANPSVFVDAALTQSVTDYWVGSTIVFTSGANQGQARYITAFTPASDTLAFAPAAGATIGVGDTYEIFPVQDFFRVPYEGTTTLRYFLQYGSAALFGKYNSSAGTFNFRDIGDSLNRIVYTTTPTSRATVTLTPTP